LGIIRFRGYEDDFVRALDYLIEHEELEEPVNVASPNPCRTKSFMRTLRNVWGSRIGFQRELDAGGWALFLRTETELI